MKTVNVDGYELICDEHPDGLYVTGYEGAGAVLDLTGHLEITGMDKKAFLCCRSVRRIYLPDSIRYMGDWCFSKCDNLESVDMEGDFAPISFGRGVFSGCEALEKIGFKDTDESASRLLAAAVSRMSNDMFLRSDDMGEKSWYEKWDISFLSMLSDDGRSDISGAVSGEEDVSYDGVASVDGEMPGASDDHIKSMAKSKCALCFLRLSLNAHLSSARADSIRTYIRERAFGTANDVAWTTVKEAGEKAMDYLQIYLSVIDPDKDVTGQMIRDLNSSNVQIRACLIDRAGEDRDLSAAFDELLL